MGLFDIVNFMPLTEKLLTSGQPTEEQFADVARDGVQLVINLALSSTTTSLKDEASTVHAQGMRYIYIPVAWENPTHANLERFSDVMDAHLWEKVLVHCVMNYRASAFVALWRIRRQDWSHEKAFAAMHQVWNPEAYPVWKAFIEAESRD
jgi:protein tyrosine phosphatase (PTP) superfamily phosphohydrolase (DUF442 family)